MVSPFLPVKFGMQQAIRRVNAIQCGPCGLEKTPRTSPHRVARCLHFRDHTRDSTQATKANEYHGILHDATWGEPAQMDNGSVHRNGVDLSIHCPLGRQLRQCNTPDPRTKVTIEYAGELLI